MGAQSSKRDTRPCTKDMSIQLGHLRIVIVHGATARVIAKVGGRQVVEECRKLGKTLQNGIAVTGAGNLRCRFIIHVDMHKKADWNNTIRAVLLEAASLEVESIAIPAIGTGAHALSPSDIARKMLDSLESFTTHNVVTCLKMVRIVIFQASMLQNFRNYAQSKTTVNIAAEPGNIQCNLSKQFGNVRFEETQRATRNRSHRRDSSNNSQVEMERAARSRVVVVGMRIVLMRYHCARCNNYDHQ
ncbi:hypothetical protein LSAT2_016611 [Lamellibrachia satsuma]|nr:hypothetical protein LSAT2_016611 [Lamellibrachia satsuma]